MGKDKEKDAIIQEQKRIIANTQEILGSLIGRMQHSASLGMSYGADNNDRDLYQILGYRRTILFENYYNSYKRDGIARRLVSLLPEAVWKSQPTVSEVQKKEANVESTFEREYRLLQKQLKINNKMFRLDKLTSLGHYGVLLLGFSDSEDFSLPVQVGVKLKCNYIQPYSQNSCTIVKFDENKNSPRYGLPELYDIKVAGVGVYNQQDDVSRSESIRVHYTRVLHVAKNILESDVYGDPELEDVYNYLQNIEKIAGGSAEMFWRGARPGYIAAAQKDVTIDAITAEKMQTQMDEFDHNLRRWLKLQGVDVQSLDTQVVSPADHIDAQLELICITKGIPKRMLLGSERGELSSSQDINTFNELIIKVMENHAEPNMLRPLIDKFIEYKILPTPIDGEYESLMRIILWRAVFCCMVTRFG